MTIADYFGGALVTIGEVIRCDYGAYPNVCRWVASLKKLGSWSKVNEAHYGFMKYLESQSFQVL